jgi:hypothetical protein
MESLETYHILLKSLHYRAERLTSNSRSLVALLGLEANRLEREDDVSCLKALLPMTLERLEKVKKREDTARYVYNNVQLVSSIVDLVFVFRRMLKSNNHLGSTGWHRVLIPTITREPVFGNVFISIGPLGLPEDVKVISTSQISCETKRQESEIIEEIRGHGYLLLTETEFSLLIERLTSEIRAGQERLPVPRESIPPFLISSQIKYSALSSG